MTTTTLGPIATTVEIGIVGSISLSTKGLHGDPLGITTAMDAGVPLTTMATTVGMTHGVAIGTTLGTMVALDTTGATDALGVASTPAGVGVAIMVVTMEATMVAMPIATGMATAMDDTMVVGIDTTVPLALAMAEAQAGTIIDLRTTLSTDVPLAIRAAQ